MTKRTPTLSKRQVAQKRLSEEAGRLVTLETRAYEYLTGARMAKSAKDAAMRAKALEFWQLKRQYPGEKIYRIREHKRNLLQKASGEHLDYEVYLREKAFSEAHFSVPEERNYYQQWFNYGHVKRPSHVARK